MSFYLVANIQQKYHICNFFINIHKKNTLFMNFESFFIVNTAQIRHFATLHWLNLQHRLNSILHYPMR